jgi:hypothetical protein
MKKKILLLCLAAMMLFVTGCDKGGGEATGGNDIHKENEKLTGEIKSEVFQMANGELVAIIKNDNKQVVDLDITVEFYDENNQFIKEAEEFVFGVGEGREVAVNFYDTPENFATYKLYADANKSYSTTFYDKVELTHSNNGENIIVQVKNNSGTVIDGMEVAVVYYKEEKAIGYDYDLESSVKVDRTANFELDYPTDKNYTEIPFDTYKVFLNSAESYQN